MTSLVDDIVQRKLQGLEKDHCDAIPQLDEWVFRQEDELKERIGLLEAPSRVDWKVLDDLFLKIVAWFEF